MNAVPRVLFIPDQGHPRRPPGTGDDVAGLAFEVPLGMPLLDAAVSHGIAVATLCGGAMHCRTCRVLVVEGEDQLSKKGLRETEVLAAVGAVHGERLACQARVRGPVVVRVPPPQDMVR